MKQTTEIDTLLGWALSPNFSQGSTGGRFASEPSHVFVGRHQLLRGCWSEASGPVGDGYRPLSAPSHADLSIRQLKTRHLAAIRVSKQERA